MLSRRNYDSTRSLKLALTQGKVFDKSDKANSMGMLSPSKGIGTVKGMRGKPKAGFVLGSEQDENTTSSAHVTQIAFCHQKFTTFFSSH